MSCGYFAYLKIIIGIVGSQRNLVHQQPGRIIKHVIDFLRLTLIPIKCKPIEEAQAE